MLYALEMTLGKRIKTARERLKPEMTQTDLGAKFGISDKAVSSWERGESLPASKKMPHLARVLKVPLQWLSEGSGPVPAPDNLVVEIEALTPQQEASVRAFIQLLKSGKAA